MAQCAVCEKQSLITCGKCNAASYCSTACQNKDNSLHFILCKEFPSHHFVFPRPPNTITSTHVLGLLLPQDSNAPQLVWVKLAVSTTPVDGSFQTTHNPKMIQYFGSFAPASTRAYEFGGDHLDHIIHVWKEERTPETSTQNQCLKVLLNGCDSSFWRGPILVMSKYIDPTDNNKSLPLFQDITLNDFRLAFNFISNDIKVRDQTLFNPFLASPDDNEWIQGVEIRCFMDREVLGRKQYRQVWVKRNHDIFTKGDISDISTSVDFPLLITPQPITARWAGKPYYPSNPNPSPDTEALTIMTSTDPTTWAQVKDPFKYTPNTTTSILVVSKDGTALKKEHVECFVALCRTAQPLLLQVGGDAETKREWLELNLTSETLERVWDEFKGMKTEPVASQGGSAGV